MENNSFSDQSPENDAANAGHEPVSILRQATVFKTRTKLLGIFALMFIGLFYANAVIVSQTKASNTAIESQSKFMKSQAALSNAISCFGTAKYWFSILQNQLNQKSVAPDLPGENAEAGVKCNFDAFDGYLQGLEQFSDEAKNVEKKYDKLRDLQKDVLNDSITGNTTAAEAAMNSGYNMISEIDNGLSAIAKAINQDSTTLSDHSLAESERFKKFPVLFLVFGVAGIAMVSAVIFFNIFQPIENIISTMIDASHDPHNTKDYIIRHEGGADEVGEVMLALNSLLLQVHEGFRRTEEAEQQSADTARQLDAIFNSVADGLITINADGEIESFNKGACSIFGYDRQVFKSKKIMEFLPDVVATKYMRSIQSYIDNGTSDLINSGPKEMTGLRGSGSEFPIELSVTSIPRDDGHTVFVNVIRDITYRKDLERQLLQSQKMEALGSLSSGIAHEINTPTQYVRDNIKFLQDAFQAYDGFYKAVEQVKSALPQDIKGEISQAEVKQDIAFFSGEAPQALAQSLEGVGRISEIVSAIRGFSYPATEDIVYIDLNEALKNTVIVSRNQWKPYTQLKMEFDENLPPVPCIPGKLTQVILNLIVNATHAIEEKTKGTEDPDNNFITLSTSATKKKVTIKVSDTGCGIPKENISKIYNPFFTTKEVGKGTGQGLSISYDIIVKKHGGTLVVESEVGKGTSFIIELPMEVENAKPSSKGKKATA